MAASHYRLDNLTVFLDYNGLQIDGPTSQVMSTEPVEEKWRSFRWNVIPIDGHDFGQILTAIEQAREHLGQPTMIVARTIKGKGVSFMENAVGWHGNAPTREQAQKALAELGGEPVSE